MSRSGYTDDGDCDYNVNPYYGAIASACRGKRGQAFFRELLIALDEMPEKRLIAEFLEKEGEFCTLGVLGAKRGLDLEKIDPDDPKLVGEQFGIAETLAREVVYENDECYSQYDYVHGVRVDKGPETPEQRFARMRKWVESKIK